MQFKACLVRIPNAYGILHDQKLKSVKYEDNRLIFTFDIKIYPEDCTNDYYKTYLEYKHCDMIVYMNAEPFNYFRMLSCPNKRGQLKGLDLNGDDFLEALNNANSVTFVECATTYREFSIELCADFYNAKGIFRKFKNYNMCYATIDTDKVEWNWY